MFLDTEFKNKTVLFSMDTTCPYLLVKNYNMNYYELLNFLAEVTVVWIADNNLAVFTCLTLTGSLLQSWFWRMWNSTSAFISERFHRKVNKLILFATSLND